MKARLFSFVLVFILISGLLVSPVPTAASTEVQSYLVMAGSAEEAARLVEHYGGTVTSQLYIINGVGALLSPQAYAALLADPAVKQVTPNQAVQASEDGFLGHKKNNAPATDYPDLTGADLVWQEGIDGDNIAVAVLDTGIAQHPGLLQDLKKKPRHIVGWVDLLDNKRNPHDKNGHGTHIAGIIANTQVGEDGEWNGMAPGIDLVGVRVLDETGAGTYETIIQGLQWVIEKKDHYNIRVVNLSLWANPSSAYWADPLNIAVTRVWAEGLVVVTVAGNGGPDPMTIAVPGNNPYAVTVGAFTDNYTVDDWNDDYITPFSASGPTLDGFVKPDLIAPGAHIVSTMFPGSYVAKQEAAIWISNTYFSMAGTSQAAAITSGAAALILARNPYLTPDEVKYRLTITALPWVIEDGSDVLYSMWQQGAGRLNVYDAVMNDEISGASNQGLDIWADLAGDMHYEGFSYFDETFGQFRLRGVDYTDLTDHYGVWDGGAGAWSGGLPAWFGAWTSGAGAWSGGAGAWSGGAGAWSGGAGAWSGGAGAWSGGAGAWSGGAGAWSGGYTTWAGGAGAWSGGAGAWSGGAGAWSGSTTWTDPVFVENFINGVSPDTATTAVSGWVIEP